jgi:hypothetical protein
MISDAFVYVFCDNPKCMERITIELEGNHDFDDIKSKAERNRWIINDHHDFCCEDCKKEGII